MNTNDTKLRFVELRANNMSLASIAKELHISKSTCSKWEKELKSEITSKQSSRKAEINDLYAMDREHKIARLQLVLERLDKAISDTDFSQMTPEALLKLKLRYEAELSKEYPIKEINEVSGYSYEKVLDKINTLHCKYESGEISIEQFKSSISSLNIALKAISKEMSIWRPYNTGRK